MNVNNPITEAVLGIDIGGTKVLVGLVARDGQILASEKRPVPLGNCDALLQAIYDAAEHLFAENPDISVPAVGIGIKGHVNLNRLVSSSILGGKVSYDFCGMIQAHFQLPVYIDNDVNAATIAEAILGAGKDTDFFVYVNIGTGSAIGIYDQGRLVRGHENFSGEIGYSLCRVPQENRMYGLETVASGKGLNDEVRRLAPSYPDTVLAGGIADEDNRIPAAMIFDAWRAGDALACEVVSRAVETLAVSVINFECMLGAGLYIFGGGVINEPMFFEKVCCRVEQLKAEHGIPFRFDMRISELGAANVGLLGAAGVAYSAI